MTPVPRRKSPSGSDTPVATDTTAPRRQTRTTADAPPAPSGPATAPRARATGSGPRPQLQKSLEELFSAPAYIYALNGDAWAEEHINTNAPRMAEAWYKLAQKNPAVKRTLEKLTTGSAWGGVAVATGATVLPMLAHHNLLPAQAQAIFPGVPKVGTPRGPIVPPPSGPPSGGTPPSPAGPPPSTGGGGTGPASVSLPVPPPGTPLVPRPGGPMTAPLAPDSPPGVVTVAATNNRAVMVEA